MTKTTLFFCLLCCLSLQAQQHHYSWKVGLHTGLSYYHGDINERFWDIPQHFNEPINDLNFLTYGLSIEKHFTKTFALRLAGLKSQVKGSDRRYESNPDYNRALNVQTDIVDGSLVGIFYFDNGKIFGERAIISPYALVGAGVMYFNPKADLLDGNGDRYYYWADNSIRDLAPNDPNAANANIIERDYVYETNLADLETESRDYSQFTWAAVFGLGFKVRLSSRIYIHGEALLRYTGTDYLDDVSGNYPDNYNSSFQAYASNPSNRMGKERGNSPSNTDWFGQGLVSLHYSFGQNTHEIRPSMIYTPTIGENIVKREEKSTPTPREVASSPATPVRISKVDTQRVVKVTKVTTTTITETTIDSGFTGSEQPVVLPKPTPTERLNYLPNELDSAFYSNVLINMEEEVIDSLFETQYQRENPAPSWLLYAINKDTTTVPVELVQEQTLPTPKVNNLLQDSVEQVRAPARLPNTTDSVKIGTAVAIIPARQQVLPPDSLRLLEQYRTQMEIERERLKNELKEQQIRYQYEAQVQALTYQLEQERQQAARQTDLNQLNQEATEKPTPYDANRQALEEQLARQQQELATLRQGQVPPAPPATNDAQLLALQQQLARQQAEIEALRQARISSPPSNTIIAPSSNPALEEQLARQQAEIEALRQQLSNRAAAPAVLPVPNSMKGEDRQALDQLMEKETALRLRLEALEKENQNTPSHTPDTIRIVEQAPNPEAAAQQQLIEALRQELQQIKNEREAISGTLQEFLNRENPSYVTKIYFDVARSSLSLQAQENLTSLVAYLQNYPTVNFWVKGYASPTGSKAVNDRLSRERAASVYNYLRSQGIAPERLQQTAYGEREGGLRNELDRRAEIHLFFSK